MRRAAFPLSIAGLSVLAFLAWMHPSVLWPGNVGWLLTGDDRGQSAIGLAAYLRAGGPWPAMHEPLLAAPEGMTLLFTDSIPLLGVVLKPLAGLLPAGVQFVGPWYLACMLLQAGFAGALVRRHAPDAATAWCGAALMVLMPPLLARYGHASLCAQWLLLWAMWIFVEPQRARMPAWWAAVLATAALIHSYLVLMVLAFWAGALIERLAREPQRGRTLAGWLGALGPAAAIMVAHGALGGPYASTHSYGHFTAALDAWWNPANPGYSALLPSSLPATPGQGFEGLQYCGAGVLGLALLMGARLATGQVDAARLAVLERLGWLLPPLLGLAVIAIGPAPLWRGQALFALALPARLIDALDAVRASGRLLWPATYALTFAAVLAAGGMRRAPLVLAAALAVQIVDLTPMLAAVRATSARADDARVFTLTRDPRWTALVADAGAVEFEPPRPFTDLALLEEIGWRAVIACRPMRYFYASREALATRARLTADTRAFAAGQLDPTRLYILLGRDPAPEAVRARVRTLDGVRVIPSTRPGPSPACASSPRSAP